MLKKLILIVVTIILVMALFDLIYSMIVYPEMFFSTWRYQLKNDIARGNKDAIRYYETKYLANGITLWKEER